MAGLWWKGILLNSVYIYIYIYIIFKEFNCKEGYLVYMGFLHTAQLRLNIYDFFLKGVGHTRYNKYLSSLV